MVLFFVNLPLREYAVTCFITKYPTSVGYLLSRSFCTSRIILKGLSPFGTSQRCSLGYIYGFPLRASIYATSLSLDRMSSILFAIWQTFFEFSWSNSSSISFWVYIFFSFLFKICMSTLLTSGKRGLDIY